jgi:DNA-binding MarR family transcriptional regulator
MTDAIVLDQARHIFTIGKMIQDRVFRVYTQLLAQEGKLTSGDELSFTQIQTIKAIEEKGRVSITELARLLAVSPPSASAMVDRLVEKGVLTRRRDPADRRRVVVEARPEAVAMIQKVEDKILATFVELVEKIGPESARKWCEVLDRVAKAI